MNMDTTGFLIELRRLKGIEIGEPTVRYHARAGRIGRKVDGLWVFTDDDIDAIMEYSGQREPEVRLGIRALGWVEGARLINTKTKEVDSVFYCKVLQFITFSVLYDNVKEEWEWEICFYNKNIISGRHGNSLEAKSACEAAWHELLMRDVLEVKK